MPKAATKTHAPKIGFVSLGCPKALVDSERILSQLRAEGYETAADYAGADVVVVNTCGFLDSARAESLDAIGEALAENGRVIVTGCLGAEASVIRDAHPNVLAITGPHQYEAVVTAVHEVVPPPHDPFVDLVPAQGVKLTPRHYAYLKISEGCNHRCSFCIIPRLRGDLVSRPAADVLGEAERLVRAGVRELLVISQDTSAYGVDMKYEQSQWRGRAVEARITNLAAALGELGAWVRLHYVYPYPHVDDLIPLMAAGKVLPYLDVPFQHASPKILKAMKRPAAEAKTLQRIREWRSAVPELTIRSTFIVGFPGETEQDFQTAARLARRSRARSRRLLPLRARAQRGRERAAERRARGAQGRALAPLHGRAASRSARGACNGASAQDIDVIVDELDGEQALGRSMADAPEIDGRVYLTRRQRREEDQSRQHRDGARHERRRVRSVGGARRLSKRQAN